MLLAIPFGSIKGAGSSALQPLVDEAATYLITYIKMTDMNISSMKSIPNEIYENFQNLIELQTSDVDEISLNMDVIELSLKRHTIPRADFKNIYAAEINLINRNMKQY